MRRNLIPLLTALLLLAIPAVALASGGHGDGGIPLRAIGFHALNFVVLVVAIAWFAGGTIRTALAERASTIRIEIENSQQVREEAQQRFEALQARVSGLEGQLAEMRSEAEADATREAELLDERAKRDVKMIEAAAERSIRNEAERARVELRREAVDLAIELATQQLKARVGADENKQLTDQFLSAIGTDGDEGALATKDAPHV